MSRWKKALSLLVISCVLLSLCVASAFAVEQPSVYELNTRYTITVEGVDDEYVIWGKALAFAVGKEGAPVGYLLTDALAIDYKNVVSQISEDLIAKLADNEIVVEESELLGLITEKTADSSITVDGKQITALPVYSVGADSSAVVLDLEHVLYSATPAVFAEDVAEGDAVSNFNLDTTADNLYGIYTITDEAEYYDISKDSGFLSSVTKSSTGDGVVLADTTHSVTAIGSPMLNSENEVVGITTYDGTLGETKAICSGDIVAQLISLDILAQEDIKDDTPSNPFAADADDFSDPDLANLAMIIKYTIFVAVILVVVLIILLIIRFRRSRYEDEEDEYDEETKTIEHHGEPTPKADAPKIRPAVRPTRPSNDINATIPVPNVSQPSNIPDSVTLTVISGKKKGYSLKVTDSIKLGRDPQNCKLLFPASDTTISRIHCAVTFIQKTGDVVLEDLGSSNGTYSASGKRLVPGKKYRVRIGDKFYLGTNENMIEVK